MPIAARRFVQIIFSLAVLGLTLWAAFKLLQFLWSAFSQVNPTVGAGVIAAAATVLVSVISVLFAKRLEFRANVEKEHREKKIPFYEEMVKFIFRITFSQKLGIEPVTEQEMIQKMAEFTENLVVWGSDDVIDAWFKFRNRSINSGGSDISVMFEIENILLAIRRDLGHHNKGLTKGKILGLFINDIHENIKV